MFTYKLNNIALSIICIAIIRYYGQTLFIPLSFAILISFLLHPVCAWLEKHHWGRAMAIILCILTLGLLLLGVMTLFFQQILSFSNEWPEFKNKLFRTLEELSQYAITKWGISKEAQDEFIKDVFNKSASGILPFIQNTIYSSGIFLAYAVIIPFLTALILYNRKMLVEVLYSFFNEEKKEMIQEIIHQTVHTYYNFVKGVSIVYLIVGTLNSAGLLLLGIPHPFLFGFIASVLTFIPYVGIITASLLPITIAWLTYDSYWYPMGVVFIFVFVQYLEGNFIFPFAVGSRLKINTLVTIMAIVIGGILWGAAGMILFVPFVAILKLIADHIPEWRSLSIFLGSK